MPKLNGTQTHENLKAAFAGESQANRRYLYFAQKADVEGHPDGAALFRSVAEGETGQTFSATSTSSPRSATPPPASRSVQRRQPEVGRAGETYQYTEMYPGFAHPPPTKGSRRSRSGSRRLPAPEEPRRALPGCTRSIS